MVEARIAAGIRHGKALAALLLLIGCSGASRSFIDTGDAGSGALALGAAGSGDTPEATGGTRSTGGSATGGRQDTTGGRWSSTGGTGGSSAAGSGGSAQSEAGASGSAEPVTACVSPGGNHVQIKFSLGGRVGDLLAFVVPAPEGAECEVDVLYLGSCKAPEGLKLAEIVDGGVRVNCLLGAEATELDLSVNREDWGEMSPEWVERCFAVELETP